MTVGPETWSTLLERSPLKKLSNTGLSGKVVWLLTSIILGFFFGYSLNTSFFFWIQSNLSWQRCCLFRGTGNGWDHRTQEPSGYSGFKGQSQLLSRPQCWRGPEFCSEWSWPLTLSKVVMAFYHGFGPCRWYGMQPCYSQKTWEKLSWLQCRKKSPFSPNCRTLMIPQKILQYVLYTIQLSKHHTLLLYKFKDVCSQC